MIIINVNSVNLTVIRRNLNLVARGDISSDRPFYGKPLLLMDSGRLTRNHRRHVNTLLNLLTVIRRNLTNVIVRLPRPFSRRIYRVVRNTNQLRQWRNHYRNVPLIKDRFPRLINARHLNFHHGLIRLS